MTDMTDMIILKLDIKPDAIWSPMFSVPSVVDKTRLSVYDTKEEKLHVVDEYLEHGQI